MVPLMVLVVMLIIMQSISDDASSTSGSRAGHIDSVTGNTDSIGSSVLVVVLVALVL